MKPEQRNPNLTEEQKAVLFDKETEPPFSGTLLENKEKGVYTCANCGQVLFDSSTKFDSGSGWPSFYDIAETGAVKVQADSTHGMERVEVVCGNCGSHLGHLFADAYNQPTGQRYCINSVSLDFKKDES